MIDIILFEILLLWSYFFVVLKKFFKFKTNILFTIFIYNISLITFIFTIIMGLKNFDFLFVLGSAIFAMLSINFLFRNINVLYQKISKKISNIEKIKPVFEYGFIIFLVYKIIF
tara:strand:+ start:1836 stop:2177 length:342 start_codon:yes stop_codon:yes gene_type:complete